MKTGKLIINNTILYPPDNAGEVEINTCHGHSGYSAYVSFESLEKWVASIREQTIKSSVEDKKVKCILAGRCGGDEIFNCKKWCED